MRICVLDDLERTALTSADWSQLGPLTSVVPLQHHIDNEENLINALQNFDVIVVMRERTPITRNIVESLPNLKLIVTTGPKNASIDIASCKELGVAVCGTTSGATPVVELAWAFLLAITRRVEFRNQTMKAGGWEPRLGLELSGKTLGLAGLGKTGKKMAKIAHAFDMKVIAWSENLTEQEATDNNARLVSKEELFRQSDYVSIHLLLSDRTRCLVGVEELKNMKKTAWLINTSRGQICDEAALIKACAEDWIGGFALDVFWQEPLPGNHPLRSADNILLTPHLGYVTEENFRLWYRDAIEDILAFSQGGLIRGL